MNISVELPAPTKDLDLAKAHMDEFGFCLLAEVLSPGELALIRERLHEQKAAEEALGVTYEGADKKQIVKFLLNKGRVFRDIVLRENVHEIARHVIGGKYQLSSYHAHFAQPGQKKAFHTDQFWMPPPVPIGAQTTLKPGDITRAGHRGQDIEAARRDLPAIAPAFVCNAMWMIDDFTADNGATLLVPGSHLSGRQPDHSTDEGANWIPATGPAGTVAIFEGRTWHSTGENRTNRNRIGLTTNFCSWQFRQQENFLLGTSDEVLREASDELLDLIGFVAWQGYGSYETHHDTLRRGEYALGELKPGG